MTSFIPYQTIQKGLPPQGTRDRGATLIYLLPVIPQQQIFRIP